MKIQKTSETRPLAGHIANSYDNSQNSAYSTEYTNAMNTYSTDEVFTGKYWIDGKKIYRKIITGTTPSTSSYGSVATGINDLETMIAMYGTMDRSDGYDVQMPLTNSDFDCAYRPLSSTFITHPVANAYMSSPYIVIFEYTKTTD